MRHNVVSQAHAPGIDAWTYACIFCLSLLKHHTHDVNLNDKHKHEHMLQQHCLPIVFSQFGVSSHCGILCVRSCTLVCRMRMSRVFDHLQGDCWRNRVCNISTRAQTICRLVVVFPLPFMFDVVLHDAVAGGGLTKHVNYATPTPSRACQDWTVRGTGSEAFACSCFAYSVTL